MEYESVMARFGVTLAQFIEELGRVASQYPDWKVACKLDDGTYFYLNDIDEDEDGLDAIVLCQYEDCGTDFFTVSDFLKLDPDSFEHSWLLIKHFTDHYFEEVDFFTHFQIFHKIAELKTGIFFKAQDGEEDVIAFRPGFVYDIDTDRLSGSDVEGILEGILQEDPNLMRELMQKKSSEGEAFDLYAEAKSLIYDIFNFNNSGDEPDYGDEIRQWCENHRNLIRKRFEEFEQGLSGT